MTKAPSRNNLDLAETCFQDLLSQADYLNDAQRAELEAAYQFGRKAHASQSRATGEPYITHPLQVAAILADLRMDIQTLCAAILHDVIEDTATEKDTLSKTFGHQIAELVDGVSKLTKIEFKSRAEAQAENFRKMVLAMSKDIRVIIIKLADRLHNMRTLDSLPLHKQKRIARETLDIFAPIAKRLGMHDLSLELEDCGFKALYPWRHAVLRNQVSHVQGQHQHILKEIIQSIKNKLRKCGVPLERIRGREKHLYSIYRKMVNKGIPFSDITDVYAVRIITPDIDACYRTLGVVHSLYKPLIDQFKDYIAIPKANGYRSLHTVLLGPSGVPIEVQIRSVEMHRLANSGISAHWLYKSGDRYISKSQLRTQHWVNSLVEIQKSTGNSMEFIENVKVDLFPDEVYVFTPRGGIMELPNGATALDFAYAVHTAVGNTCVAAKIDRQLAPLATVLSNGQQVEVVTAVGVRPNASWLKMAVTAKAITSIRQALKQQQRDESIELGRRLLDTALSQSSLSLDALPTSQVTKCLETLDIKTLDDLLVEIGLGNRPAPIVAQQLAHGQAAEPDQQLAPAPLMITGSEGLVVRCAQCCLPIPGDPIIGVLDAGQGILIHIANCPNALKKQQISDQTCPVAWADSVDRDFKTIIDVTLVNERGVLAMLAFAIAEAQANIDDLIVLSRTKDTFKARLTVMVTGRMHLANILRVIKRIKTVMKTVRVRPGEIG